jgi:hypothetical protein
MSTFNRARFHSRFSDVKNRQKHFHVRCRMCEELKNLLRKGWTKGYQKEKYKEKLLRHTKNVKLWRQLESILHAKAKHTRSYSLKF